MRYTTTKCRNCGFRTRSHESNVPNVQLGCPILRCPKCGNLILDNIATEYEFMTNKERAKFTSKSALTKSFPGNILFIIMGVIFLIGLILTGGESIAIGIFLGGGWIILGIFNIVKNVIIFKKRLVEQAIYESLQRTQNKEYVNFLGQSYSATNIERQYRVFSNKNIFLKTYKSFESRETYIENIKDFNELIKSIEVYDSVDESQKSTFIDP